MQVTGSAEDQGMQIEQQLYSAVTATSSWLDDVENTLFSRAMLLTENAETQLSNHEVGEPLQYFLYYNNTFMAFMANNI